MLEKLYEFKDKDYYALHHKNNHMTYRELFKRAQSIAYFLYEETDLKKTVCIYGDKENDVVAAFIGAIMADKVYVMLPTSYPMDRINKIVLDCHPDVIFNISDTKLEIEGIKIVNKDTIISEWNGKYSNREVLEIQKSNPDEVALILYTSGTTGKPKGVEISFNNILAEIDSLLVNEVYESEKESEQWREVGLASYSFSMGLIFYGILGVYGGEYFSVPSEIIINTEKLLQYLIEVQPYGFSLTPSLVKNLFHFDNFSSKTLCSMRLFCLGGEPLTKDVAEELIKRFPETRIMNCYGLTETSGASIKCRVTSQAINASEYYLPVSDCKDDIAVLIDENRNIITDDNIVGEFCFIGDMVTIGYHNDSESTEKSYITMSNGQRGFCTGDMGVIKNGYMFLVNRLDNMVKIGGNRVELEEVEENLLKCKPVSECAVVVGTDSHGNNNLVGYVVKATEYMNDDEIEIYMQIQSEMSSAVEPYKIPKKIIVLNELPKNVNGKMDRKELARRANE